MQYKNEFESFADAAKEGTLKTMQHFVDNYRIFRDVLQDASIRKGEVNLEGELTASDRLAASLVLNNITSINFERGDDLLVLSIQGPGILHTFGTADISVTIPPDPPQAFLDAINRGHISPAFVMSDTKNTGGKLRELEPLIRSGRIIPRPHQGVMYLEGTLPGGNRQWAIADAHSDDTPVSWQTQNTLSKVNSTIPLKPQSTTQLIENKLFDVTIPFIKGIDFKELNLILDDEHDILEEFRAAMREIMISSAEKNMPVDEMIRDILRPKIAKIDRKFTHIVNMGRLKVGASVIGTAVLGLTTAYSGGTTALLSALMGASGAALVVKEAIAAYDAEAGIRDENLYILWRLQRRK